MNFIFKNEEQAPKSLKDEMRDNQMNNNKGFRGFVNSRILDPFNNKTNDLIERSQNYQIGIFIMATGFCLIALSFFFFPLIFIRPYKFCALYSMGSITIIASIVVMRGNSILKQFFRKQSIIYSLMFLISLLMELYFSVIKEKYILVLVSFGLNLTSTLYLACHYIPSGVNFLNYGFSKFFNILKNTIFKCFKGNQDLLPVQLIFQKFLFINYLF